MILKYYYLAQLKLYSKQKNQTEKEIQGAF